MTLRESRPAGLPGGPGDSQPSAAQQLIDLVTPLFGGAPPLRIRAWDDSVAGPEDAPTVVVSDPAALRRLVYRPGELGLAQAYVTKEIDVEGDLLDGFRRVWLLVVRGCTISAQDLFEETIHPPDEEKLLSSLQFRRAIPKHRAAGGE